MLVYFGIALAYVLVTGTGAGARDALVLYGENAKPMLVAYALSFMVFLVMLAPAARVGQPW